MCRLICWDLSGFSGYYKAYKKSWSHWWLQLLWNSFRLKNLVQTYENPNCLTRTKILKKKRPRDLTLNTSINRKIAFASIFWKFFKFLYFLSRSISPIFALIRAWEGAFDGAQGRFLNKLGFPPCAGIKFDEKEDFGYLWSGSPQLCQLRW